MMTKTTRYTLAVLFSLLWMAILHLLGGCATTEIVTPEMTIKTKTLWKDIEKAEASTDELILSLGTSTSADDAKTMMALCLLFPSAEGCP